MGSELILYDIDPGALNLMEKVVKKYLEERKGELKVTSTTHLEEAVEDVDFAIITIRVGGIGALRAVIEIPLREGVLQTVGDTVGPSGILKGLLEIPAILSIAEKLKDLSPKAIILNFTNPMTPICRAVVKGVGMNIVGLCHGVHHIRHLASKLLGLEFDEIWVKAAGINHLTWTLELKHSSEDMLERFAKELYNEEKIDVLRSHPYLMGRELHSTYGLPPTLSDRHVCEFFPYLYTWYNTPEYREIIERTSGYIDYKNKCVRREVFKRKINEESRLLRYARGEEKLDLRPSNEYALDIISSMKSGGERELLAVNIPNRDYIKGIPQGYVVEIPGRVSKGGVEGVSVGSLPRSITAILRHHLEKFELLVDGILERDKSLVLQAMALDPLTPSPEKAKRILERFLQEVPKILPASLLDNYSRL